MKFRNYCLALVAALLLSALPLMAQSSGTTSGAAAPAKSSTKSTSSKSSSASPSKLDINAATADQLKALPGIDAATAQKIIAGRPYHAKNDLVSKNIISKTEYDSIKDEIIAHRASGASGTSSKTAATK
ncbi:MAG: helix-hairpin-helix domain-containing protein [Candidatus Korobacteraceae bacterium]